MARFVCETRQLCGGVCGCCCQVRRHSRITAGLTLHVLVLHRHFHTYLPVSEDESLKKFMNYVRHTACLMGTCLTVLCGVLAQLKLLPPAEATKRAGLKRDRDTKLRKVAQLGVKEGKEDAVVEEVDDLQQLYCICHRPSFGDMIACDDGDCPYEWFHLPCVKITPGTRPAGHWYCPQCRDRRRAETNRQNNRGGKRARGAAKEDPKRK